MYSDSLMELPRSRPDEEKSIFIENFYAKLPSPDKKLFFTF